MSKPNEEKPKLLPYLGIPITIESQLEILDKALTFPENQVIRDDIEACRKDLLRDGTAGGYYQGGKKVEWSEIDHAKPLWVMGACQYLASSTVYPDIPGGQGMIDIYMEIRFDHSPTGPRSIFVAVLFDTGSSNLCLFDSDAVTLGIPAPTHPAQIISLQTANRTVWRQRVSVQARIWSRDFSNTIGDWFPEMAVIVPLGSHPRLTGRGIKQAVYAAMAPEATSRLFLASHKTALARVLPAVDRW
ncbi:hypothetical protein ABW19_dt0204967 [Dactylella cylindrospora]|nr:hypothetical protein ABW19_dt0204967 [Dactylella cylindrospora]